MRFASLDDCLAGYAALYEYDEQERKRLRLERHKKFTPHERFRLHLIEAAQHADAERLIREQEANRPTESEEDEPDRIGLAELFDRIREDHDNQDRIKQVLANERHAA